MSKILSNSEMLEHARYRAFKEAYLPKWIRDNYEIQMKDGHTVLTKKKGEQL